jgi:hypothetical protein
VEGLVRAVLAADVLAGLDAVGAQQGDQLVEQHDRQYRAQARRAAPD